MMGPRALWWGSGTWRGTVPQWGRRIVTPQEISSPQSSGIKQEVVARERGFRPLTMALHSAVPVAVSWSLIPVSPWAGAGLRHLVPSLALLVMFTKPSVHGCLNLPPARSHPSRLDAADPRHPVVKTGGEDGQEEPSRSGEQGQDRGGQAGSYVCSSPAVLSSGQLCRWNWEPRQPLPSLLPASSLSLQLC